MPKSRSRGKGVGSMRNIAMVLDDVPDVSGYSCEQVTKLVRDVGVAYFHGGGCVVLNNGSWLQPEQWKLQLQQMIDDCESEEPFE